MRWEELTAADFARAVHETQGVCVIAFGVIEKHSDHLPLGTDYLNGHRLCELAARREPAVVFPPFYFGQIYEARCFPGTVTLPPALLLELARAVFDEIGRNGFHKIVIHNAHGGNWAFLQFLTQCALAGRKPYTLYLQSEYLRGEERKAEWKRLLATDYHGHACECETSVTLANFPELVHMDRAPAEPAPPLGRMSHLPGCRAGIGWYANHPDHYAGDARPATREKGEALLRLMVESLAEFIAAVKADRVAPALEREFFERSPLAPPPPTRTPPAGG